MKRPRTKQRTLLSKKVGGLIVRAVEYVPANGYLYWRVRVEHQDGLSYRTATIFKRADLQAKFNDELALVTAKVALGVY